MYIEDFLSSVWVPSVSKTGGQVMRMSNYVGYMKNKFNNEEVTGANKTRAKD
jgi:hypothetical protein